MGNLLQDLRYAIRILRKSPVFTAVVILSLALGIGANTAIFTLIDSVMLRTLPVKAPEQLVLFGRMFPYPRYEQFRDRNQVFSGIFAVCALDQVSVGNPGAVQVSGVHEERASGRLVSGSYFSVLGVNALLGRTLAEEDDRMPGGHQVAVISHGFWKRRFGLDPSVIGRTVILGAGRLLWGAAMNAPDTAPGEKARPEGTSFTIVGVMPPEFFGETVGDAPDFWIPMMMQAQLMPGRNWLSRPNVGWVRIVGRMMPGTTSVQAEAQINVLFKQLVTQEIGSTITEEQQRFIREMKLALLPGGRGFLREEHGKNSYASIREFNDPLLILMAMVAVVLLISCANVANLLLARSMGRQRETAVRLSLGVGRLRLMRQHLTESVLLALFGGAAGLLFATWGSRLLVTLVSEPLSSPLALSFHIDLRVLTFTAAISLLTGILFGLAPAYRAMRMNPGQVLKDSRNVIGGRQLYALRKLLVVAQVGLSLLLLMGAALLVRSIQNLREAEIGYARERVLMVRIDPITSGYRGMEIPSLAEDLRQRFAAIPGVRAVTYSENGLFNGPESAGPIAVEGYTPQSEGDVVARFDHVGPGYFSSVGIPLLLGRDINERDSANSPRIAVMNEAMAHFYFQDANPVGRRIFWLPGNRQSLEIVGVAKNVQDHSVRWNPTRRFYVPFSQPIESLTTLIFEVRTAAAPDSLILPLRKEIQAVDSSIPILNIQTLEQLMDRSFLMERIIARLAGIFGILALLLASLGLYGVMSYAIVRRTNEIGIRMALGARSGSVVLMILRESMTLVLAGIALGIPAGLAATRLISKWLFGLKAHDPWTIASAVALLLVISGIAGYLPARRAARVDPMIALRHE
ncbi:MAG TPA: ABC transporter permease [Acidobacteriota bacterium]|nr:ABC transporter permease [Acidobacteriota bacterium]